MSLSLFPGPDTFTADRLHAVWREGQSVFQQRKENYRTSIYENITYDANHNFRLSRRICLRLHVAVRDPAGHRERIDQAFAPFSIATIANTERDLESKVCVYTQGIILALKRPIAYAVVVRGKVTIDANSLGY